MQINPRKSESINSRQDWRILCELVASQAELSEELALLTELLGLPLSCCLAVHQVLREGNWKNSTYPGSYIMKAARTLARKDDTLECGGGPLVLMDGAELDKRWDGYKLAPISEDVDGPRPIPIRPLKGKHYVRAQFAPDEEVLWREEEARERGPFWPNDCKAMGLFRDWRKLGEKAGLDAWENKVLQYRRRGISREKAMELQPDEVSRKALQAAWRRFDRTGLKKVRDSFDKIALGNVPDEASRDTRDIESYARSTPKSFVWNNPLQAAWKQAGGTSREDLARFLHKHGRSPRRFWGVTYMPQRIIE